MMAFGAVGIASFITLGLAIMGGTRLQRTILNFITWVAIFGMIARAFGH